MMASKSEVCATRWMTILISRTVDQKQHHPTAALPARQQMMDFQFLQPQIGPHITVRCLRCLHLSHNAQLVCPELHSMARPYSRSVRTRTNGVMTVMQRRDKDWWIRSNIPVLFHSASFHFMLTAHEPFCSVSLSSFVYSAFCIVWRRIYSLKIDSAGYLTISG
jgi:hypothetical protein